MRKHIDPPLEPKNGVLRVIGVARISTVSQENQSLADQEALLRQYVAAHYEGEVDWKIIATQGSGERLDRPELEELRQKVEAGDVDLVIAEDLGRIMRDLMALQFCSICLDTQTRVIAINDHLDNFTDGWDDHALFASWQHKKHNALTSSRIKQRLANRFQLGGTLGLPIAGYIKPIGAKTDSQLRKDDSATPIIQEVFRRLRVGANYSEVADYLNNIGFKVGPYTRVERWTGVAVRRWITSPILKGERFRNRRHSVKHHGTGRRRAVKAPPEMLKVRQVPHLAHVTAEEFDSLMAILDQRNRHYRRSQDPKADPLLRRPKKRTRWPGHTLHQKKTVAPKTNAHEQFFRGER